MKWAMSAAALALGAMWAATSVAQETTLTILSHKVHENVSRGLTAGTTGGDVAGEWAKRKGVKLNWITANIEPMHDRLFRELSLRESSIDVAFVINKFSTPRIRTLLEPLDGWQEKNPSASLAAIPAAFFQAVRNEKALVGIPFRHATTGLHWNSAIFAERGLDRAPQTADEVVEYARKASFTRDDGTRVHGLIMNSGDEHLAVLTFLKMFGAELFDANMKVTAGSPAMVKGLTVMAQLYKEGVLPPNYASVTIDEVINAVQSGRAAMAIDPFARSTVYNNPQVAKNPGAVKVVTLPGGAGPKEVALTEIWSMVIPKNSKNKELAWDLLRELSTAENVVRIALNGNGPVLPKAYEDETLKTRLPYMLEEVKAIGIAEMIPSNFNASLEALSVFREESQAAVIGMKTPEQAAASMQRRIERLVKS